MIRGVLQGSCARYVSAQTSVQRRRRRNTSGIVQRRLLRVRWRRLRAAAVEMSERQQTLDREREKRELRASSDVRSKPFHVGVRLGRSEWRPARPIYVII